MYNTRQPNHTGDKNMNIQQTTAALLFSVFLMGASNVQAGPAEELATWGQETGMDIQLTGMRALGDIEIELAVNRELRETREFVAMQSDFLKLTPDCDDGMVASNDSNRYPALPDFGNLLSVLDAGQLFQVMSGLLAIR